MNSSPMVIPKDNVTRPRILRKTLSGIGLFVLLGVPVFLLVMLQRSTSPLMLRVGDTIPNTALEATAAGRSLLAHTNGKRVAIFFFSADCPHCRRQIPILKEMEVLFAAQVEFVAIALKDQSKSEAVLREHNIKAKVVIDENGIVGGLFGISELPTLFLVNRNQRIEWSAEGETPKREILRRLAALVATNITTSIQAGENTIR